MKTKMKIKKNEHYWVGGFVGSESGFTQNPLFFMGFSYFKTIFT